VGSEAPDQKGSFAQIATFEECRDRPFSAVWSASETLRAVKLSVYGWDHRYHVHTASKHMLIVKGDATHGEGDAVQSLAYFCADFSVNL
jgi:hypothetical protein